MEIPYSVYQSPRRMCEGIEAVIPPEGGRIVRRPFNHYSPALTDWWIVPSLELPFFKFGKYFFTWDEKVPGPAPLRSLPGQGARPDAEEGLPDQKRTAAPDGRFVGVAHLLSGRRVGNSAGEGPCRSRPRSAARSN